MGGSTIEQLLRDEAVTVGRETTAEEAIRSVMKLTPAEGTVYYVYVTANDDLVGVLSMRELLNAENTEPVSAVMSTDPVSITADDSVHAAARTFVESRFATLPVVDTSGTYRGILRANDVIDALDEKTAKQLFKSSWPWI